MIHEGERFLFEKLFELAEFSDIAAKVILFIAIEQIGPDDFMTAFLQLTSKPRADESGPACDENSTCHYGYAPLPCQFTHIRRTDKTCGMSAPIVNRRWSQGVESK